MAQISPESINKKGPAEENIQLSAVGVIPAGQ